MNNGTVRPGTVREFHAAVIAQLPDLTDGEMQRYIRNKKGLGRILREALQALSNVYHLSVNYGRSVKDGIKAGRYDWVNKNITGRNFPTDRKGEAEVEMEIIPFKKLIPHRLRASTDEVLNALDRMGYRPDDLQELLAFAEKYPDAQREGPIAALGSVWQSPHGNRHSPFLWGDAGERYLNLLWVEHDWNENYRFAAVRK